MSAYSDPSFRPARISFAPGGWDRLSRSFTGLASWALVLSAFVLILVVCGRVARMAERDKHLVELPDNGPMDSVWALDFSGDGTRLASASVNGNVLLEDLGTRRVYVLRNGPVQGVRSLSFSGDGSILAVAGDSPTLGLWDAATGAELAPLDVGPEAVNIVEFSPRGKLLATAAVRSGNVTIRDWATRKPLATWPGAGGSVQSMAFSPDGRRLCVACTDGALRLGDVAGRGEPLRIQAHQLSATSVAFSPDGRILASASSGDLVVRLWDPAGGAPLGVLPVRKAGANSVSFSASGKLLATAGMDGWIRLWEVDGLRVRPDRRRHGGSVQSVAFSPDGTTLASGSIDGTVRVWALGPDER